MRKPCQVYNLLIFKDYFCFGLVHNLLYGALYVARAYSESRYAQVFRDEFFGFIVGYDLFEVHDFSQ